MSSRLNGTLVINNIKTYSCPIIYLIGLNLLPLQYVY